MKKVLLAILCLALMAAVADDRDEEFRRGMKLYEEGKFAEAAKAFEALENEKPGDLHLKYNSLTCKAAEGRLGEAINKLGADFSSLGSQPEVRAKAAYNLGTAFLKMADEADQQGVLQMREQELRSAVQWLQQSLLDFPGDRETKNNLEYANKLLEKLEEEQQRQQSEDGQEEQQQQNGQKQDSQGQQEQENKEKQKGQEQEKKPQQGQGREQQQQDQRSRPEGGDRDRRDQSREIPKEVAQNLLKAAREAELQALKMLRNAQNKDAEKKSSRGRDW